MMLNWKNRSVMLIFKFLNLVRYGAEGSWVKGERRGRAKTHKKKRES
jgi:hypothetical protein